MKKNENAARSSEPKNITIWIEGEEKITMAPGTAAVSDDNSAHNEDEEDRRPITVTIEGDEDLTIRPVMPPMAKPKSN